MEPFEENRLVKACYRPFTTTWLYNSRLLNEMRYRIGSIFPTPAQESIVIQVTGTGATKDFSALVSRQIPDLEVISKGQCLPLYYYEKRTVDVDTKDDLFSEAATSDNCAEEYIRHDGITDDALQEIRTHYQDQSITKEDIFYYVYGLMHSEDYRQKYGSDLKKDLPRVPYAEAFWEFSKAGRDLAYWHLNYEDIEPFPLTEHSERMALDQAEHYKVRKMKWGGSARKPDKSKIEVNDHLTLSGRVIVKSGV